MKNKLKIISRKIWRVLAMIAFKILFRYKVEGREKIPKNGSLIFCGNHRSYLDPVLIILASNRNMRFMAKEELKKNPIIKFIGNSFELIYLKRDSKDIASLKEALKTLKRGDCIGIFPEGTRNGMKKNNGNLKDGAAYLALKTGAQLVPIGIVGEPKAFHKNIVKIGDPIDITKFQTKDKLKENENKEKVTNIIKEEIIKLTNGVA